MKARCLTLIIDGREIILVPGDRVDIASQASLNIGRSKIEFEVVLSMCWTGKKLEQV